MSIQNALPGSWDEWLNQPINNGNHEEERKNDCGPEQERNDPGIHGIIVSSVQRDNKNKSAT